MKISVSIAVVSACALVSFGCGGDDDDSGSAAERAELAIYDWTASLVDGFEPGLSGGGSARELAELRPGRAVVRDDEADLYFVLEGEPGVSGADVASAASEEVAGEPAIVIKFTGEGERRLEGLIRDTAEKARRRAGVPRSAPSPPPNAELGVVIDGRLFSKPLLNVGVGRDVDLSQGLTLTGGLGSDEASELAERLDP